MILELELLFKNGLWVENAQAYCIKKKNETNNTALYIQNDLQENSQLVTNNKAAGRIALQIFNSELAC